MKLPFVLSVLLVLLTGCSTPKVWYQPGKTPADAHRALAGCQLKATQLDNRSTGYGPLLYRMQNEGKQEDFIRDCMKGEGWQLISRNLLTNGTAYPEEP